MGYDYQRRESKYRAYNQFVVTSFESKAYQKRSIDMFVDELGEFVSVVEIKSTDWDKIEPNNIRKLLTAHRRQIWNYISKYLDNDKIDVCPGIIYPRAPTSNEVREYIEEYLNSYGIQVVWYYD